MEKSRHRQTLGEEIANSISHGLGFLAAVIATPFLIVQAVRRGDGGVVTGVSIFAATVIFLYLASTLYHALPHGKAKRVFRTIEHGAIFLLIAGTYTPFTLGILRGPWGWTLFGIVWGLAGLGVFLKFKGGLHPVLSTILYVCMGWLLLVAIRPFHERMAPAGIIWTVTGGLAYTLGVIFYSMRRKYSHFIWHLFVLAGTTAHFFAIWGYAI